MIPFDVNEIRNHTISEVPAADFDGHYTFYYDETNNIRKFYVKEEGFNYSFESNFVLGGIVLDGAAPDLSPLFAGLKLQKTIKEIKLKHIAKGEFIECLESEKLKYFLQFLLDSPMYVHYSSLNVLNWAIVDIVDSAIVNSEAAMQAGPAFAMRMKNDLYKLAKLEIDAVIELFYQYGYPNVKENKLLSFINDLVALFDEYIDSDEFHFGLESLRQILKESSKKNSLPFIMDEEDHMLIKNYATFYLRPIYLFKNSDHIFDNEFEIVQLLGEYQLMDGDKNIKPYSFEDSADNQFIQVSDVFVGLIGKLSKFINAHTVAEILEQLNGLTALQGESLDLLIAVMDKAIDRNIAFIHSSDSYEELNKMAHIRHNRQKIGPDEEE